MSKLFYKNKRLIGLEVSNNSAKVMAIEPEKYLVRGYGQVDLDADKMKNVSDMAPHLKERLDELFKKNIVGSLPSNHTVISVPTSRTFTRSVSLPRDAESNLNSAVQLEAEQYIPVNMDELYTDWEVIEKTDNSIEVLISAVPKLQVDSLVNVCHEARLQPLLMEPSISSVARLIRTAEEGELATAILDIGAEGTDIAVLDKSIRVTGGINIGGHTLTEAVMKELNLTHDAAHMLRTHKGLSVGPKQKALKKAMEPLLGQIAEETRKITRYYSERISQGTKLQQLIIVGGGSNVPGIGDYFTEQMELPARAASPWQILDFGKLAAPSKQIKPRYITAIGLSLIREKGVWK